MVTIAPASATARALASPSPEAPPETKAAAPVSSTVRSPGNDRDPGCPWGTVELGVTHPGSSWYLPVPGGVAQLQDQLMDLTKTGSANGLTVGQEPTIGVHGQGPVDLGGTLGDQLLLFPVLAEPVLRHVDD